MTLELLQLKRILTMLGFPCRHCGRLEFFHQREEICDEYYGDGVTTYELIPLREELLLRAEVEEMRKEEMQHKRGYRYSLGNCPGFEHRKCDVGTSMIERTLDVGFPLHNLPSELMEKAETLLRQREEEMVEKTSSMYSSVHHTYIAFNPKTGVSSVAIGE